MSLQTACKGLIESFTDGSGIAIPVGQSQNNPIIVMPANKSALVEVGAAILSFSIVLTLVAMVGKFLWNDVIVDLFTIARPVKSVWPIIGLMIFMSLIR